MLEVIIYRCGGEAWVVMSHKPSYGLGRPDYVLSYSYSYSLHLGGSAIDSHAMSLKLGTSELTVKKVL